MAIEGILINGVTEILKKLIPDVAQEIGSAWGVKDELKKLQRTLEMILAVIADAERKQVTDEGVRLWLRWLRDVAYDVDDVMGEFSCETMRLHERDSLKFKVRDFVSSSNPLTFRFKLSRKIKEINKKLDEITKDMDRFQLKSIPSSTTFAHGESSGRRSRQTTSFGSQSQIVGREDDKTKLIKLLTTSSTVNNYGNHPEKVPVVSIVGMGGLGKTTLAQLVYNDDSVKKHFGTKIWVCVSYDFDVYRLLSDIMESTTQEIFSDFSNFDVLVRKVREQLTGKRYLLVLDDLWNEDAGQWERLQSSLIVGAQGSKILITTRKRQVADAVKGSISPYLLGKLQVDECWSIMENKAFSPGGALQTPNMTNIGKEIANKCSGLPLAAKFLGSLMHSKNTESNWLSIRENDVWNTHENQSKIIPILKLSYDNLSPHLQRCFSYCSIFPKDWELSKQTLIQLWMSEGFLQPSNGGSDCSFEDTGDLYFESLMWSSFFDGVEKNELDDVTTFKMHDLVHDLAQAVVGDHECSTVKVTDQLEKNTEVRRLNIVMDKELSASKCFSNIKKLRTVIILEPNYTLNLHMFSSNKHLRILHLGRPAKDFSEIRYTTSKLRQLRYFHASSLDFRRHLLADYSISRLYNLQTLILSRCSFVQNLVNEIGSLKHLRHLDISFSDIQELPDSITSLPSLQRLDLNHCKHFTTFPDSVTELEHLRYLDMSFTPIENVPDAVTNLCNLRILDVNTCKNLKKLPEYVAGLRNLSIFNFKDCPLLEALPEDFGALYQLRSLDLEGTAIKVLQESCGNLHNLEYVNLCGCELPKEVTYWNKETPLGIGKLICLQQLMYGVREKVKNNPEVNIGIEELENLNFLEILQIFDLQNVKDPIDVARANFKGKQNLWFLHLEWDWEAIEEESWNDLRVFEAFTASIGQLPRLRCLNLRGMSLKRLDVGGFPYLTELELTDMFLLEDLCYSYPCLQKLWIRGCTSCLTDMPSFPSLTWLELEKVNHKLVLSVGRNQTSLTDLWLENIEELIYLPVSILQNNCNLLYLSIKECNQLESFGVNDDENENVVAAMLDYSGSLQVLEFVDCPALKFLPDLRGWTSLQQLVIFNCPQLEESLTYDLKSLSFLEQLGVDFIQRDEQRGDPSDVKHLINLMK